MHVTHTVSFMKDTGETHFDLEYDETKQLRKKELQIRVCFWSSVRDKFVSCCQVRYFMGHATGEDTVRLN